MREELIELVKSSITYQYTLPNSDIGIDSSIISTKKDVCFSNKVPEDISKIIYNSIIEYAKNEYKIDFSKLNIEQLKALKISLRYNEDADDATKQKYGFYGEVLLFVILKVFMRADVLISKGYFYSPLERSEAKGYDVFHLIERKNRLELWFGESKFYKNFKPAIKKIICNLDTAISDTYLNRNLLAIIDEKDNVTTTSNKISELIMKWEENPDINLAEEVKDQNIKLVYPMFVAYDKKTKSYEEAIKECIDVIKEIYESENVDLSPSFQYSLFFILLPLNNVKKIKGDVIEWITERKPLI